ncbi:MAG: Multifunctional protein [Pseudomonadota bacterium]|jgi:tRNA nucleotidyltransferase (CCA-adding enzyme)
MVSPRLLDLARAVRDAGGRARLVGGCVRDHLIGLPSKDLDLEVHGLALDALRAILRRFGRVDEVGRSFGVLKVRVDGADVDVSLPRRDSRAGTGHKGIHAEPDPDLGETEAARRRDLTVNAIAWDPLTDTWIDPFGGVADVRAGVLRAVDPATFGEDPLRALRVVQFAGRFGWRVDPALAALCADMPLGELPAERIRGEVEKLLLRSTDLPHGWEVGRSTGAWAKVLPDWDRPCPTALVRAAAADIDPEARRLALLYAAAASGPPGLLDSLDRLRVFRVAGVRVRDLAQALVAALPVPDVPADGQLRRWADTCDVRLLCVLADRPDLLPRAEGLGVHDGPLPALATGADAVHAGFAPGPAMGAALRAVRDAQLDGRIHTPDEARALLHDLAAAHGAAVPP